MGKAYGTQGAQAQALNSTLVQLAYWIADLRYMIAKTRRSVTKLVRVLINCIACKQGVANVVYVISNLPGLPPKGRKTSQSREHTCIPEWQRK